MFLTYAIVRSSAFTHLAEWLAIEMHVAKGKYLSFSSFKEQRSYLVYSMQHRFLRRRRKRTIIPGQTSRAWLPDGLLSGRRFTPLCLCLDKAHRLERKDRQMQ